MRFKFKIAERVEASETRPGGAVRFYDLIPIDGNLPQNWIRLELKLPSVLPAASRLNLVVATALESKTESEPVNFTVALEPDPQGQVRLLLKMLGRVQSLSLQVDPAQEIKIQTLTVRQFSRPFAMGWLVTQEMKQLALHPTRAWQVGLDSYRHFKQSGSRGMLSFLRKHLMNASIRIKDSYDLWVDNFGRLTPEDRLAIQASITQLKYQPKISVLVPVYNSDERWLRKALDSVLGQLYPHWELCIADDHSSKSQLRPLLEEYAARDPRVKIVWREKNGHISAASNSALAVATGEFVALLDHDDELTADALYWVAKELNQHPESDLLYSDEDKIDGHGRRFQPHFKMEWNLDLFYSLNLVTHLAVFRTQILKSIDGFRVGYEGSQDYDLVLRVIEKTSAQRIRHIPRILYHWRAIPGSTAIGPESKDYAFSAAQRALRDHFHRVNISADVVAGYGSYHRVRYALPEPLPLVSAIICTRDRLPLLKGIVTGLLEKTDYPNLEILIIDNESKERATLNYFKEIIQDRRVKVFAYPYPFNFAAMNNFAVTKAAGVLIAFINNDLEVIEDQWLKEMVSFGVRPEFGAVGARLLYPDGRVQHAGVVLGVGGVARHAHKYSAGHEGGYLSRSLLIQGFSAVTAACLLTKRSVFDEVGGFDGEHLPVAFNDVDFCLKVRGRGYRIVYTPYAQLYHLESASRGSDLTGPSRERFERENAFMQSKWGALLKRDPFYNPNLTLGWEDYGLAFPPRIDPPAPRTGRWRRKENLGNIR